MLPVLVTYLVTQESSPTFVFPGRVGFGKLCVLFDHYGSQATMMYGFPRALSRTAYCGPFLDRVHIKDLILDQLCPFISHRLLCSRACLDLGLTDWTCNAAKERDGLGRLVTMGKRCRQQRSNYVIRRDTP